MISNVQSSQSQFQEHRKTRFPNYLGSKKTKDKGLPR